MTSTHSLWHTHAHSHILTILVNNNKNSVQQKDKAIKILSIVLQGVEYIVRDPRSSLKIALYICELIF